MGCTKHGRRRPCLVQQPDHNDGWKGISTGFDKSSFTKQAKCPAHVLPDRSIESAGAFSPACSKIGASLLPFRKRLSKMPTLKYIGRTKRARGSTEYS
jgi:hypothetical protein